MAGGGGGPAASHAQLQVLSLRPLACQCSIAFSLLQVHFLYSACGALLFVGFILYDTSNILRNLSYDDYIIGAIQLYLDILNLFLYILQLLSSRD